MRKFFAAAVAVIFTCNAAFAGDGKQVREIPVPEISYAQKVEIIVPLKKNPDVLSAEIGQSGKAVILTMTVANDCNAERAKKAGNEFLLRTKNITMDDPAGKDKPGKGMYDYSIKVVRSNGKIVAEATKKADGEDITWF